MRIVLSGASGLIGTPLKRTLSDAGHETVSLVRRAPSGPAERRWDPAAGELDAQVLAGADAVINLSGAGVGEHRWTDSYQRTILDSRTRTTGLLARTIAGLGRAAPPVLLSASAVGYYGDTGERAVEETDRAGDGYLAEVCRQWERATEPAERTGHTRVAYFRTGLVLSGTGGLLSRLRPLVKAGLGGRLGSGRQYQPWISLHDEIGAIVHLLDHDVAGPVNLTGPDPVRQSEFVRTLAGLLHRPAVLPTPGFALRIALGQFATEGVLAGQRAVPAVLRATGFRHQHATLSAALRWALGP